MKLDRFDIASIAAAVAILVAAGVVGFTGKGAGISKVEQAKAEKLVQDPMLAQKLAFAKASFDAGQLRESAAALSAVAAQAPGLGEPHALLGQAYSRLLEYPSAMREYKYALLIDPDYVDNRSGKFIGKRIKAALRECLPQIKESLRKNPEDQAALAALSDARYLERMLAGGCD